LYSSVPSHFKGVCAAGDKWPDTTCNKKLIGCRYFTTGFGGDEALKKNYPDDFASCRWEKSSVVWQAAVLSCLHCILSEPLPSRKQAPHVIDALDVH
jgi:hypothetical protein